MWLDWWICLPETARATWVGRASCIDCHREAHESWKGSHHDLAMDLATEETVLGDFDDAEFEHHGIRSRLFRRDGGYWVHTEGPDGKLTDFAIKWVLGVDPLQQYMVEFDRPADMPPHEIARVQVLRICWDTRRKEWFYLPPPDVPERLAPDDPLHWTGIGQRWNTMCADCHSTDLEKHFDVATGSYHTTFSEIDVSCEACHGPASLHVELATSRSLFWDRKRGYGLAPLKASAEAEIQACAPCHSRRGPIAPGYVPGEPYHDFFQDELLQASTYHADGQILDEVYEHGSFLQSRMYHKGIRCTDCHDPHTAKLRHTGNAVCTSCHQHGAGTYDTPAHHFHRPGSPGASCVECHMPQTTYMEVHPRRDHSIRIPRPDQSVELGTPNACSRCHLDRDVDRDQEGLQDRDDLRQYQDWVMAARNGDEAVRTVLAKLDRRMADAYQKVREERHGRPITPERRFDRYYAPVLDAARRGDRTAERDLVRVVRDERLPAIVRATVLMELISFDSQKATDAAVDMATDAHPRIRAAAIDALQGRLPDRHYADVVAPLLQDPLRLVRIQAARALGGFPPEFLRTPERRRQLASALEEYERGLMVTNDRAGSHMMLAALAEEQGRTDRAMKAYRDAIRVEPGLAGPRSNLAALNDRLAETEDVRAAQASALHQADAVELAKAESKRLRSESVRLRREELDLFARDAGLVPDAAGVQYRYGLLLYLHRRFEEAEEALEKAVALEPNNPDFLIGLILFFKERNEPARALPFAERLLTLRPNDPLCRQILEELRRPSAGTPEAPPAATPRSR
jgi:Flp pilus assembly protein TadD